MIRQIVLAASLFLSVTAAGAQPSAWMATTGRTTQPIGHYELCQRSPIECDEITPNDKPFVLTHEAWAMIIDVNNYVDTTIEPRTDQEVYGKPEYWAYPAKYGDCEDYALLKRRILMEKGIPAGDLLMTVVRQPNGDGHAVLTVHTDRGDFILDNLDSRVRLWTATNYQFVKRQSESNSGVWVSIEDGRSTLVGSIK